MSEEFVWLMASYTHVDRLLTLKAVAFCCFYWRYQNQDMRRNQLGRLIPRRPIRSLSFSLVSTLLQ